MAQNTTSSPLFAIQYTISEDISNLIAMRNGLRLQCKAKKEEELKAWIHLRSLINQGLTSSNSEETRAAQEKYCEVLREIKAFRYLFEGLGLSLEHREKLLIQKREERKQIKTESDHPSSPKRKAEESLDSPTPSKRVFFLDNEGTHGKI